MGEQPFQIYPGLSAAGRPYSEDENMVHDEGFGDEGYEGFEGDGGPEAELHGGGPLDEVPALDQIFLAL